MAKQDFTDIIAEASQTFGVPQSLIEAVITQESAFNPSAKSHTGALGLMQLMPGTAKDLGVSDPLDPRQNVLGGTKYLSQQLKRFGTIPMALAAYNAGPGAVSQYGKIPPYKETQGYVKRIMANLGTQLAMNDQGGSFATDAQDPQQAALFAAMQNLAAQQQQEQPVQPMAIPEGLFQPRKQGLLDVLNTVMGGIGTVGGTAANIIGAVKGGQGGSGNAAVQAGLGMLEKQAGRSTENQQMQQLKAILEDPNTDPRTRNAIIMQASGLPANLTQQLIGKSTSELDRIKVDKAKKELENFESDADKRAAKLQDALTLSSAKLKQNIDLSKFKAADPLKRAGALFDMKKDFVTYTPVKNTIVISEITQKINDANEKYQRGEIDARTFDNQVIRAFFIGQEPNSIVREGEFAQGRDGQPLVETMVAAAQKIKKGGVGLSDESRRQFVSAVNGMFDSQLSLVQGDFLSQVQTANEMGVGYDKLMPVNPLIFNRLGIEIPSFEKPTIAGPQATGQPGAAQPVIQTTLKPELQKSITAKVGTLSEDARRKRIEELEALSARK